jgi:non-ribosomal peptide synthetase component E (peptide arylation enzyme)
MAITQDDTLLTQELIERHTAAGYWTDTTLADVFRHDAWSAPSPPTLSVPAGLSRRPSSLQGPA